MDSRDYEAFAQAWADAWEVSGKSVGAGAIDLAFAALEPYALQDVTRALSGHIRNPDTGQFPPKPADIVRYLEGDSTDAAGRSWTKFVGALQSVGPYQSVVFDDPLIHVLIDREGGWIKLSELTEDELPYLRNRWEKAYRSMAQRPVPYAEVQAQLPGIVERDCGAHGYMQPPPVLIGNPDAAERWSRIAASKRQEAGPRLARVMAPKRIGGGDG